MCATISPPSKTEKSGLAWREYTCFCSSGIVCGYLEPKMTSGNYQVRVSGSGGAFEEQERARSVLAWHHRCVLEGIWNACACASSGGSCSHALTRGIGPCSSLHILPAAHRVKVERALDLLARSASGHPTARLERHKSFLYRRIAELIGRWNGIVLSDVDQNSILYPTGQLVVGWCRR